jgi:hypothetical protein
VLPVASAAGTRSIFRSSFVNVVFSNRASQRRAVNLFIAVAGLATCDGV